MSIPHRIAAGGIIIRNSRVLLVKYRNADGGTYLVGPGGALEDHENAFQAVVRETREETGLTVCPRRVLFIEDLLCKHFKMCKIWILCDPSSGEIQKTEGARAEGILEAGWYRKEELADTTVFPPPLMSCDWRALMRGDWQVQCLSPSQAGF